MVEIEDVELLHKIEGASGEEMYEVMSDDDWERFDRMEAERERLGKEEYSKQMTKIELEQKQKPCSNCGSRNIKEINGKRVCQDCDEEVK